MLAFFAKGQVFLKSAYGKAKSTVAALIFSN